MQKIKILVAMHKAYSLPGENIYAPIQVGGVRIPGMENALRDDTGENISAKNKYYCEMTALYWAWKNLDADCIGLVHYEEALEKAPVILPQKRNYWIETTYSQYAHAHHKKDMDLVRSILEEHYPEYVRAFDDVMERTAGHRFNMFIMRRDLLDHYCTWLFDVLDRAERQINLSEYDEYNKRVFGFLSERLLDVWVETNHISYTEMPVVFMESQHWLKKGMAFIERKFRKNWT